jgi:hypothetical protein
MDEINNIFEHGGVFRKMKIKRMVKRLFAVGTGVAMLGATAMGAMAADLSDYPTMFVENGRFNGFLVVGDDAQAVDNLALTDIAARMSVPGQASTTTTLSGDSWKVATSSKSLELSNSNASDTSITGETFRDVTTFIGDEELGALSDGVWSTNEQEYDYEQFLFFDTDGLGGQETNRVVKYAENDDDVTADHLFFKNGKQIGRYKMEFSSTAQSDVTDSSGTATTTGTYLDDFENTELSMMGLEYSIVLARRVNVGADANSNGIKLTMMAGSERDTLLEGESRTYTVVDKTYDVELTFVDSDEAKFVVNGEPTNKLKVGETYVLSDKSEVGVSEVLYQNYAGGVHSVDFFVGAQKTELRDDDVSDVTSSHDMKVGSEDIDGAAVIITGTDDNSTFSVTTIEVNMTAEDDYFVGANQKLSDVIAAADEEAEALMGGAFDIEYLGLSEEPTHDIRLKTSSSRRYKLRLFDGDDNPVDIPVAYAQSATNLTLTEDSISSTRTNWKALILNESDAVFKDDYFVLAGGSAADGSAKSYLLQYKSSDKSSKSSPKIKFKDMGSGETLEYSLSTGNASATIKLGGYSFAVDASHPSDVDNRRIFVDLDGGGTINKPDSPTGTFITFVDSYGSQWTPSFGTFGYKAVVSVDNQSNAFRWVSTTDNSDDYDNQAPSILALNITATTGPEVRAALEGVTLITPDGETEVSYGYTTMGSFIRFDEPSGDPDELTLTYPKVQKLPQIYFTSGSTSKSTARSGDMVAVEVVDATKLASEIADVQAQNLVVVGGPCVNRVSAQLLGNPSDCTEGFTPGEARVKLWEHANGNMAMLVAGYSGADTRLAGKVVANRPGDLVGTEVVISGPTASSATVRRVGS